VLGRDEAIQLLTGQLPALPVDEVGLLAEDLGELPLALAQAAGYLTTTGMSVRDYRQTLAGETQEVLSLGQPVNYPRSLAAAVTMSVNSMREADPVALAILRMCAFLARLGTAVAAPPGDQTRADRRRTPARASP